VDPGQPGDQREVDAEAAGPRGPRRGGGQPAALGPAQLDEVRQPVKRLAGSHRRRGGQLPELFGRGENAGRGGADVEQGAAQVGAEDVRGDAGRVVLVPGAAAGDLPGGLALPRDVDEPVVGELAAQAVQHGKRPRVPGALVGLPAGAGGAAGDEPVEELVAGDAGQPQARPVPVKVAEEPGQDADLAGERRRGRALLAALDRAGQAGVGVLLGRHPPEGIADLVEPQDRLRALGVDRMAGGAEVPGVVAEPRARAGAGPQRPPGQDEGAVGDVRRAQRTGVPGGPGS
jgi:hypothetical protein